MMGRTASVQINLGSGEDSRGVGGYRCRWELAHRIGPVLVAAFANSPIRGGPSAATVSPASTRSPSSLERGSGRRRQRRILLNVPPPLPEPSSVSAMPQGPVLVGA